MLVVWGGAGSGCLGLGAGSGCLGGSDWWWLSEGG